MVISLLVCLKYITSYRLQFSSTFTSKTMVKISESSLLMSSSVNTEEEKQPELFKGNPIGKAIWDWTWKRSFMKPSKQGESPTKFGDAATVLRNNIEQVV